MIAVLKQRAHKHLFKQLTKMRKNQGKEAELTEFYFGYGANLNTDRFAKNNMFAEEVGSAFLKDHELGFTLATEYKDKGYAGVEPKAGKKVPGVLVKMDKLSLKYLDVLEWCGFGAYERKLLDVECDNQSYKAWVYTVKYPNHNRIPSTLYIQNMVKAAKERNFPKEYIEFLESIEHRAKFEIDHSFSLRTYKQSRKFVKELYPIYKLHDQIRDVVCGLI